MGTKLNSSHLFFLVVATYAYTNLLIDLSVNNIFQVKRTKVYSCMLFFEMLVDLLNPLRDLAAHGKGKGDKWIKSGNDSVHAKEYNRLFNP